MNSDRRKLAGKTVVITGASSGIGADAARKIARLGATVCLLARREDELAAVEADIEAGGGNARVYPVNLANAEESEAVAKQLLAEHPRIDALVNNAGRSIRRPIVESTLRLHDYERTMAINYFGAVRLTLALVPRFVEQGHGHVVAVSTMSTQVPIPLFSAYLASKSALESFVRSLDAELGATGVTSTIVYFPMVRTPMSSATDAYDTMKMMSSDKAADWLVKAVVDRPKRVSTLPGAVGELAMAALPGLVTTLTRPLFKRMG